MELLKHKRLALKHRKQNRGKLWKITALVTCTLCAALWIVAQVNFDGGLTADHMTHRRLAEGDEDAAMEGFSLLTWIAGEGCGDMNHVLAICLWILGCLFLFLGIAIVCDDFFVASLEKISEVLNLSDDVAGATFMAAGSSAPELFTSIAGAFFVADTKNDNAGPGTILGSAVFNITIIIGASVVCAGTSLGLEWWPLLRDGACYAGSIITFAVVYVGITPGQIDWWEAVAMVCLYALYIVLMMYNERIMDHLGLESLDEAENAPAEEVGEVELMAATESTVDDGEGRDREGSAASGASGPTGNRRKRGNSLITKSYDARPHIIDHRPKNSEPPAGGESSADVSIPVPEAVTVTNDAPAGEDDEEETIGKKILCALSWPWTTIFGVTIPECNQERWANWYVVTFLMSICWIGLISYLMVEFAIKIGRCLGVSTNVMGLTILAAGTSVPDAMSSILVAKMGKGNMAISNALGSNIFDILLGMGLPWSISTLIVVREPLLINTLGLPYYVVMLFGVLIIFLLMVRVHNWTLHVWHGYVLLAVYVLFVVSGVVVDKITHS